MTTSAFGFGDEDSLLPRYGFFVVNSRSHTWPGGTLLPNNWGLFDMHGNTWEWCWDWYAEYPGEGVKADPQGPGTGESRVLRGGSWYGFVPGDARSADRIGFSSGVRGNVLGFRVVCSGVGVRTP